RVVVETPGGLGLEVLVPDTTAARLPQPGQTIKLLTHLIIKEDSWQLAGFMTSDERQTFLTLLGVTGVGPKLALAVLGQLGTAGLSQAVVEGRWKTLQSVSGVGPKLAQRLLVELKGALGQGWASEPTPDGGPSSVGDEVVEGLMSLGYTEAEARRATAGVQSDDPAARLRDALKQLDSGRGASNG
ncbi:MAG: Holliday junction branch migration protein RuvA, partial [Gemmataceae bacterium]